MALTKDGGGSLTPLTASGNTDAIDLSAHDLCVCTIEHTNKTGTVTAEGTCQPQVSHDGTNFKNDGGAFSLGSASAGSVTRTYTPPGGGTTIRAVRFVYTEPTYSGTPSGDNTLTVSYSRAAS